MNEYIIIGYSGHSYVVVESAAKAGIIISGYSDVTEVANNPYDLRYLGFEGESDFSGWGKRNSFILGIGDNKIRQKMTQLLYEKEEILVSVIHPNACISKSTLIGDGTFISSGAQINSLVQVGKSVIINTGTIIEHECQIGDFAHIAPGAVLAGNVTIGERTLIGANSVVKEGVSIGDDVVVGAGSVVLKDVQSGVTVVGNPAKEK